MTMRIRSVDYAHDGYALRGELAWDDAWSGPLRGVASFHGLLESPDAATSGLPDAAIEPSVLGFLDEILPLDEAPTR